MDELRRGVEITPRIAVPEDIGPEDIGEETSGCTPSPVVVRAVAAEKRSLPSFFVIGPPRTGSGWLHEVCDRTRCCRVLPKRRDFSTRIFIAD
jgi:hypothetical protein